MAVWVIGYGTVQASAPAILRHAHRDPGGAPDGATAAWPAFVLAAFPAAIGLALASRLHPAWVVVGLILFGMIFALNSAVHSYLILAYTSNDKVAMNVPFYYMANACGRLAETVCPAFSTSAWVLPGCLYASAALALAAGGLSCLLPGNKSALSLAAAGGDE